MGALPAATTKVNLDAATDDPKQARTELVDILDKFNEMRIYLSGLFGSDGVAATARTNLGVGGEFAAGTEMIFGDSTLPSGWTHNTGRNDEVVRIVSGTGNTSGGSASIAGGSMAAVAAHDHTITHDHDVDTAFVSGAGQTINPSHPAGDTVAQGGWNFATSGTLGAQNKARMKTRGTNTANSGSGGGHTPTYNIKYRDYVSATKD